MIDVCFEFLDKNSTVLFPGSKIQFEKSNWNINALEHKRTKIEKESLLLIPSYQNQHVTLFVLFWHQNNTIELMHFNSLGWTRESIESYHLLRAEVLQFIQRYCDFPVGAEISSQFKNPRWQFFPSFRQQTVDCDCSAFVFLYAVLLSAGLSAEFISKDPNLNPAYMQSTVRKKMAKICSRNVSETKLDPSKTHGSNCVEEPFLTESQIDQVLQGN